MSIRTAAVAALLLTTVGACGDAPPATNESSAESATATPVPAPPPTTGASASPAPDLTDELIAEHGTGRVRWAREGQLVTFPDGSTGLLSRAGEVPVLTVTVDGVEIVGAVPDHQAEGGLAPTPMDLDSGGAGYVVHQGGGEFAAMNLMVMRDDALVSAGQACYDLDANAYEPC